MAEISALQHSAGKNKKADNIPTDEHTQRIIKYSPDQRPKSLG